MRKSIASVCWSVNQNFTNERFFTRLEPSKMKIICAGLSKTGTKSLAAALRFLGFTVFDFDEHRDFHTDEWFDIYYEGKLPDFTSMYKDVDAVTDIPPAFWFEEIHEAFPDAKVILSLRDSEEVWAKSWAKQNEMLQSFGGLFNRAVIWAWIIAQRICGKRTFLEVVYSACYAAFGSLNSKSTVLFKKKYREHNERVQAVIPKEKLLIYNVKQGWKPLCEFLGCDVPKVEFPRENIALALSYKKISEKVKEVTGFAFYILAMFALLVGVLYFLCY